MEPLPPEQLHDWRRRERARKDALLAVTGVRPTDRHRLELIAKRWRELGLDRRNPGLYQKVLDRLE
jgi:hypothetical protein